MASNSREKHEKEFKSRLQTADQHRENDQQELARAELIQALAYAKKHLGPEGEEVVEAYRKLACLHAELRESDEELDALEQRLEIRRRKGELAGVVDALQDVALCHASYERHDRAEEHYRQAIAMCDEANKDHHRPLRQTLLLFGDFLTELERYAEAITVLERGLHVCAISESYPSLAGSRTACTLGLTLMLADRAEEGAALLEQALPLVSHRSQDSTRVLRRSLVNYANFLQMNKRQAEAEPFYAEAVYQFSNGPRLNKRGFGHLLQAAANNDIGLGKRKRAERRLRMGIKQFLEALEPHHPEVFSIRQDLVNLLIPDQRYADAEPLLTEMVAAADHPEVTDERLRERQLNNLGFVQVHLEEFPKAEANLRRALASAGDDHGCYAIKNLGLMYQKMGYTAEAIREYERALPLFVKEFGSDHAVADFIRKALAELRAS